MGRVKRSKARWISVRPSSVANKARQEGMGGRGRGLAEVTRRSSSSGRSFRWCGSSGLPATVWASRSSVQYSKVLNAVGLVL